MVRNKHNIFKNGNTASAKIILQKTILFLPWLYPL